MSLLENATTEDKIATEAAKAEAAEMEEQTTEMNDDNLSEFTESAYNFFDRRGEEFNKTIDEALIQEQMSRIHQQQLINQRVEEWQGMNSVEQTEYLMND